MRLSALIVACGLLLTTLVPCAHAGQIGCHIYTALRMKDHLSGNCRVIVDTYPDAYLAGAQGPDITGVVQHGLGRKSTMPVTTIGEESHYDKTGRLALNILFAAKKDAEIAFALGWMTHFLSDRHVHPVVNRYGGFYQVDEARHKALEQLESKHVYVAKSAILTKAVAIRCPHDLGHPFAMFILQGYHWTFPGNNLYISRFFASSRLNRRLYSKHSLAGQQGEEGDPCKQSVPRCQDAADINDDGRLDGADAITLLGYLFQGGAIPGPFTAFDYDETLDELRCIEFSGCP